MKTATVVLTVGIMTAIPLIAASVLIDPKAMGQALRVVDDYSKHVCNEKSIKLTLDEMVSQTKSGHFGYKILYIKNVAEVLRSPDELKCSFTAHPNRGEEIPLIMRLYKQDGYELVHVSGID